MRVIVIKFYEEFVKLIQCWPEIRWNILIYLKVCFAQFTEKIIVSVCETLASFGDERVECLETLFVIRRNGFFMNIHHTKL